MQSELLTWERQPFSFLCPPPTQEHEKVELLRKAVQAHRAYTDRVSEPYPPSLLSITTPACLSIFPSIPGKNCLFPELWSPWDSLHFKLILSG